MPTIYSGNRQISRVITPSTPATVDEGKGRMNRSRYELREEKWGKTKSGLDYDLPFSRVTATDTSKKHIHLAAGEHARKGRRVSYAIRLEAQHARFSGDLLNHLSVARVLVLPRCKDDDSLPAVLAPTCHSLFQFPILDTGHHFQAISFFLTSAVNSHTDTRYMLLAV